jgi:site-specific recombinase XerD
MAKLMLALMELNVSLYDFFDGVIYEQQVKTKTKQNVIEIINTKDFFEYLQKRGVRKSDKTHDNLSKFLQLDPNYPNLIMIKKIAKCLDEMSKNEELMAGIFAAAEDDDGIAVAEG